MSELNRNGRGNTRVGHRGAAETSAQLRKRKRRRKLREKTRIPPVFGGACRFLSGKGDRKKKGEEVDFNCGT